MRVKIRGTEWQIKECSNSEIPLNDGIFFGRTFYFDRIIYLNKDLKPKIRSVTLRHELTHAFLWETQINTQEKDFAYTEEMLCEFVGKYGKEIEMIAKRYESLA